MCMQKNDILIILLVKRKKWSESKALDSMIIVK